MMISAAEADRAEAGGSSRANKTRLRNVVAQSVP